MDPLAEKYPWISPYAYCGNNPMNRIDPTGMDWYQSNDTKYYTWYEDNKKREGYTYIGEKGSLLGEFETSIDNLLTGTYKTESMFSEGFTFDIVPNDKGALIGSKERDWDFVDEFAYNTGPEFSVFLSDHPYTEAMKTDDDVLAGQQYIYDGKSKVPEQVTNWKGKWNLWDALTTPSMAKQFIGSYRFNAFTSADGKNFNNIISDSKSRSSFFYHLVPESGNRRRGQTPDFANTYQFYIWQSPKK
jgi:hypothetical protein